MDDARCSIGVATLVTLKDGSETWDSVVDTEIASVS